MELWVLFEVYFEVVNGERSEMKKSLILVRVVVVAAVLEERHKVVHTKFHVLHLVSRQRGRSQGALLLLKLFDGTLREDRRGET